MTGPFSAPPDEPLSSRSGCGFFLVLLGLFAIGFVGVGALLFLRAPDTGSTAAESPLAKVVVPPPGYDRLSEDEAGGGRLDETRTRIVLSSGAIAGFRDAMLVSYGRPRDQAPRAVVVLAVQLDSAANAEALLRSYRGVAQSPDLEGFPAPEGWVAFHQREDAAGRYAQRVAFAKADRLFVVSVVTPKYERDTSEVLALARRQAG